MHVPITVALLYATTTTILNRYNEKRNYKPWAISKTRAFRAFVVFHNVFLALYSAFTFFSLVNAVKVSLEGSTERYGLAGAVDAFCKINGPRGLGDAATFNTSTNVWGFTNRALKLAANNMPDTTDIGRIWNEGLAFYGWLFYLSKFYEVFDTLIILAKGRTSSLLQMYHHAGAMLSMWAGIRYMAPPIWMFVLVNSFIHTLMVSSIFRNMYISADSIQYTYYTATALGYRVPNSVKRTITTMQITQFMLGATFALAHLFVAYSIPVSVPYIYSLADLTSSLASDVSSAASTATASASAGVGSWLKKVAFRAAGEEGLAENVRNEQGKAFGIDAIHAAKDLKAREEIRYRDEFRMIHCIDTSGQVFAILLNCFYLAPLTVLFVRFFIRSYIKRAERRQGKPSERALIEDSSRDAIKGVKREVQQALDEKPDTVTDKGGKTKVPSKETSRASKPESSGNVEDSKDGNGNKRPNPDEEVKDSKDENGNKRPNPDEKVEDGKDTDGNKISNPDEKVKDGKDTDGNKIFNPDEKVEDSKDMDGGTASNPDDKGDADTDERDKEDIEILDSAEAVTDVLAEGVESADKFSKGLENSKAG